MDLEPSACIPDIPYTDLSEILKIYGDAEDTVSVSRLIVEPATVGEASPGMTELRYLNEVTPSSVLVRTSFTTKEPL